MAILSKAEKKILLDNLNPFSEKVVSRLNHANLKLDKLVFKVRSATVPEAAADGNNENLPLNAYTNNLLNEIGLPTLQLISFSVAVAGVDLCPGGKWVCNGGVCKWVCPD